MRKRTSRFAATLPLIAAGMLGFTTSASAVDVSVGKRLHDAHCESCHTTLVGGDGSKLYTRESRRVQSFPALERQVNRCVQSQDLTWSKAQINDVIAYLNQTYYQFKE